MPQRPADSVFDEPQFREGPFRPDPSERLTPPSDESAAEPADNSVWDEPTLACAPTRAIPGNAVTYEKWLLDRRASTTVARSWLVTLAVAAAAGPWAVLGALWGSGQSLFSVLAIIVVAPVVEETMKMSIPLYIVERRPFIFRSRGQILLCGCAAGLAFATIENVLYLNVYIHAPTPGIILWRWTVCEGVHVLCSMIVAFGIARVWHDVWRRRARADLDQTYPCMLTAVVLHGAYNGLALAHAIGEHWTGTGG